MVPKLCCTLETLQDIFFLNTNAWLLPPYVLIRGTNWASGFFKASTSESNMQPNMETTGLPTYPVRKDASWGEAVYLL